VTGLDALGPLGELLSDLQHRVAILEAEGAAPESPWMDTDEAADHLRLPKGQLYKLARAGVVPSHQPEGKGTRLLFNRRELDAWARGEPADLRLAA